MGFIEVQVMCGGLSRVILVKGSVSGRPRDGVEEQRSGSMRSRSERAKSWA